MKTLAEIVKESKFSHFKGFEDSQFWYTTDEGYSFAIPASDIVGITGLKPHEKTIGLMKWIKSHMENTKNV
jgi:hypothetical protein